MRSPISTSPYHVNGISRAGVMHPHKKIKKIKKEAILLFPIVIKITDQPIPLALQLITSKVIWTMRQEIEYCGERGEKHN
jgi:galactose-1-phosphate uridylyltransferase